MFYPLLYSFYIFLCVVLIVNLLLSGSRPPKTLSWALVILLIPIGGILLYIMFGINRRKHKFFKLRHTSEVGDYLNTIDAFYKEIDHDIPKTLSAIKPHLKLSKLIIKNSSFLPFGENNATLLRNGTATFESIFEALEKAHKFIHFQYYIIEEGFLTKKLIAIFERKRKAGVEIRVIYDGIGSRNLSWKFIEKLEAIGVQIYGFLPLRIGGITTTLNYRNHRKIIIVDGEVGFTGGINFSDDYIDGDPALGAWHDMHLRLEGQVVGSLHAVFAMDWYFASTKDELLTSDYFPAQAPAGNVTAQIVSSGPDSDFSGVRQQYFTIINQAEQYVYIANSYVIPGDAILEALQTVALSGVDVRLLIPEVSDNLLVKWSVRSYFQELLHAGVKIYLYQDGFLHSKTYVRLVLPIWIFEVLNRILRSMPLFLMPLFHKS